MRETFPQDLAVSTETKRVIDPGFEETGAGVGFGNESIIENESVVVGESFAGDELLDFEAGISTTEDFIVEMNKKGNRPPKKKSQIKERRKKSQRRRWKKQEQLKITRKSVKRSGGKTKTRPRTY